MTWMQTTWKKMRTTYARRRKKTTWTTVCEDDVHKNNAATGRGWQRWHHYWLWIATPSQRWWPWWTAKLWAHGQRGGAPPPGLQVSALLVFSASRLTLRALDNGGESQTTS
jgi:hypothetical protein